jgi:hypothetical protein
MTNTRPKARTRNLIRKELDSEIIFYDLERLAAGSVSRLATKVLNHCNGKNTPSQISELVGSEEVSEQDICYVLEKLNKAQLLEPGYLTSMSVYRSTSRRELFAKLALGTVPLVVSIHVPYPADAASACIPPGGPCHGMNSQCCQFSNQRYICTARGGGGGQQTCQPG